MNESQKAGSDHIARPAKEQAYSPMHIEVKRKLARYLEGFISENKATLFNSLIRQRTRHITIVLEDIYQSQNASAVLRSCDCFGIQDVHIIENKNPYTVNRDVTLGATKWLNLKRYNKKAENTADCYNHLKKYGYRIIATSPHRGNTMLHDISISHKLALVFGTELEGLSEYALKHADGYVKIPMYGFTESFNISVSAAIILHHLTEKMRISDIDWGLNEEEMLDTRIAWMKKVLARPALIIHEFLQKEGRE